MSTFLIMVLCVAVGAGLGTLFFITHSYARQRTKWIVLGLYAVSWLIDLPFELEGTIGLLMQIVLCIYYVLDYQYLSKI